MSFPLARFGEIVIIIFVAGCLANWVISHILHKYSASRHNDVLNLSGNLSPPRKKGILLPRRVSRCQEISELTFYWCFVN